MADDDDLDYSDTNVGSAQAHTVRKNISLKLKGKSRGGRGKKGSRGRRSGSSKKSSSGIIDDEVMSITDNTPSSEKSISEMISLEDVISKLETPAFSQMDRAFPEPMHQNKKLRWDHKVNLIGEKVVNPMIHCCEKCTLPILIYGRIVPCKHVFCFDCTRKMEKLCFKCEEQVQKVEQASLGTVFMCIFGGSRYGPVTCGRTYLSQRDLQAHINHRHLKTVTSATGNVSAQCNPSHSSSAVPLNPSATRDPRDPRGHLLSDVAHPSEVGMIGHAQHSHGPSDHRDPSDHPLGSAMSSSSIPTGSAATQRQYPHSPANYSSTVPVSSARPNLITVPIQDDSSAVSAQHVHSQQPHSSQYPPAGSLTAHSLPSHQHPVSGYPPLPHAYQHPIPAAAPAYSQAPPMTTQAFTPHPPPQVHHPPPMHTGPATLYSTPPPVHHPPPVTYSVPQTAGNPHSTHALPPQRFPTSTGYDEPYQLQPWSAATAPPPTRGSLPPRPITAPSATSHPLIPPQLGPSDPSFRPPYYQ